MNRASQFFLAPFSHRFLIAIFEKSLAAVLLLDFKHATLHGFQILN